MLYEGTAQFLRHADWLWNGYHLHPVKWRHRGNLNTLIDARRITRMDLRVKNLDNYQTPEFTVLDRSQGSDSRKKLCELAECMRSARLSMDKVRFTSYSDKLKGPPEGPHCGHQVENIMRNLMSVFSGVQAKRWEFGIMGKPHTRYWVLFEIVQYDISDPGLDELRLLVDDRVDEPVRKKFGKDCSAD